MDTGGKRIETVPEDTKMKHSTKSPSQESEGSKFAMFDSMSDCGYKSGEISSQMSISDQISLSDSGLISEKSYNLLFDSGLVSDAFSSSTDIYSPLKPEEKTHEAVDQNVKEKYIWSDIFSQDQDGDTILHLAIVEARSDVIFPLIRLAPHPDFLDITNDLYQTLLHLATLTGKSTIARRLVVAGATLDIQDHVGNTPLHIAARNGDLDCLQAILAPISEYELTEAQCSYQLYKHDRGLLHLINMKNYEGQSCVHLAAEGRYLKVMECLYNNKADMENQDGKTGQTALHYAIEQGNSDLVKMLISKCKVDPEVPSYAGQTPYHIAKTINQRNPSASSKEILHFVAAVVNDLESTDSSTSTGDEAEALDTFNDLISRRKV